MSDYSMKRGDTFKLKTTVSTTTGSTLTPVALTGWKMWFTVKKNFADPDERAVHRADSEDGSGNVTFLNQTTTPGQAVCVMPPLKTFGFPDAEVTLVYDIQIKTADGDIATTETGTIKVTPDVSRSV